MTRPRTPSTVGLAYVAASTSAAICQYALNVRAPAAFVAFALVTTLALRFRADRWTTVLLLLNLAVAATTHPPDTVIGWVTWCALGTSLAVLHLLTPWLPWRHDHLDLSTPVLRDTGVRITTCAAACIATAVLAAIV